MFDKYMIKDYRIWAIERGREDLRTEIRKDKIVKRAFKNSYDSHD